jgi:hypothetical protein
MPERFTLPRTITGSTWPNVMAALWERSSRGLVADDEGTQAPNWTNREALAVVMALRKLAGRGFPLWYQFAAVAYGWSPDMDQLTARGGQGDRPYPPEISVLLSGEIARITSELEAEPRRDPQLDLEDLFDDKVVIAAVTEALKQDGADAAFKIPLPACKDPATGRPAKPVKDPRTGKWTCPGGGYTIDDPITAIVKSLSKVAIPVALIYGVAWVLSHKPRRSRRPRKR